MNSKELVKASLSGTNTRRIPRQMWYLPWAEENYPAEIESIRKNYPDDIVYVGGVLKENGFVESGDPFAVGSYTDPWGCVFENCQRGIIGEVKQPLMQDEEWSDAGNVHIPEEWLSFDVGQVNSDIKAYLSDKYVIAGRLARPFEQLQFIRGTENLFIDLMMQPVKFMEFKERMHDFHCRLLKKWAQTDVDALMMMDDWGSQRSLLINPALWDELFAPMYRDYIDIAHSAGKKMFMHSDGYTLDIIPKLIDMGLDAINSQIFCMGIDKLKQYRGEITFWGEIDRQHLIPNGTEKEIVDAVTSVYENLYDNGHCIAQCEFGAAANPRNVELIYETWDKLTG